MAATKITKAFYNTEFPEGWSVSLLGELGTFSKGKGILKEQVISEGLPCIRYGEIYTTHDFIIKGFKSFISEDVATESKEIKNGDILFAGSGETVEEIGKAVAYVGTDKAYAGGDVIILSTKKDVNSECLSYALETDFVKRQKRVLGQGNSVVHIYSSDLSKVKIPLPPLPEQKAIARLLSTWDEAIHKTEQLITQKELRNKWLMQQLLTGKKRLKGFGTENYKKTGLDEVLIPVRIPLLPEADHLYGQIGIRSHGKGIFYKEKVTGKELGEKRVFWIQAGCFILNIVFAWEQAVAITTEAEVGMIASHRFPMYKPAEGELNLEYILYFFKSPRGKQLLENASPGGAGRNKTLGQTEFLSQTVSLPTINEQTAIARVLQAADNEINLLKAKADKLREQKKGLMQVLLTGKKRLKYDT